MRTTAFILSHASRQRIIPPRTRPKVQCIRIPGLGLGFWGSGGQTHRPLGWTWVTAIWVTWGRTVCCHIIPSKLGSHASPGAPKPVHVHIAFGGKCAQQVTHGGQEVGQVALIIGTNPAVTTYFNDQRGGTIASESLLSIMRRAERAPSHGSTVSASPVTS